MLFVMGSTAWGDTYTLYSTSSITAGDYILVGYQNTTKKYYAMNNTVTNNQYLGITEVTISNDAISESGTTIVWNITASTNGYYIKNGSNYLDDNATSSKNYATTVTSPTITSEWNLAYDSTNKFWTITNYGTTTTKKTLSTNIGSNRVACYSSVQSGNTCFYLYKKNVTTTLSSLAVSGTPTKTTYEAGEALDPAGLVVTGTYSDSSTGAITEGISWTFDPATLTAGTTSCTATAKVGEISSSAYNVTGLTVNASKTLIGIEVSGTPAEFWKGDTFNHNGLTVTATWDDESKTDVTSEATFSTPDMATSGQKTVTVTYKGETATYDIDVKTIANTQATAYTITEAIAKYNAGKDLTSQVFVKGTVSAIITEWSTQFNNITYAISEDGTTTSTQFSLFRCVTNGAAVGDDVVAHGTLGIFSGAVQLASGNSIVALTKATTLSIANISVATGEDITPVVETNISSSYLISYVSDNEDVVIASGNEMITGGQTGTATITATISANGYKTATTTFTVTVTSAATLSSITVGGTLTKSTYTLGDDFDFSGLTATGKYSDNSESDLTSTVVWTVEPSTLTAATTSVTVKATSGEISGTKAYNVIVNKKTATISIANMEIGKNAAGLVISAVTTPADAELTYSIVSGSAYVSLSENKLSAIAPGEATIKAEYAGNDEYASAEKSFTVTVSNLMFATKEGFTDGDNTGSHNFTNNSDISFEAFKGNAGTAPAISSNCLRLYQNGSYVTVSGGAGVSIKSVTLTTGSTYASTTIGTAIEDADAPTTGTIVDKSSPFTVNELDCKSISFYCLGTDKYSRLDVASISVKYEKEAITLKEIALSGNYKTEFIQNETFTHNNLVVTASYNGTTETQDVTSSATFSTVDMTTTGTKTVTVSYTEGEITKTADYSITVAAEEVESISLTLGANAKTRYKAGDSFDNGDIKVKAIYNSGREVEVTDAVFSGYNMNTEGKQTVTVTYAEKTASYRIVVLPSNVIFYESFDGNNAQGGNDGNFAQGSGTLLSDNTGWTFTKGNGAKECAKFGAGSAAGSAQTPALGYIGSVKITFKAAAWNYDKEVLGLTISASTGVALPQTSVTLAKAAWTEYTLYAFNLDAESKITIASSQSTNNRFFLDEVMIESIEAEPTTTTSTLQGWKSYVSDAANFKVDANTSIYVVSSVGTDVTLSKVPGNIIKKGSPVLLKTEANDYQISLTATEDNAETSDLWDDNKLAVSVAGATGYMLAYNATNGLAFYKTTKIPAGKVYLPITSDVSALNIVVDDTEMGSETGISSVETEQDNENLYNLNGVKSTQKKGLLIRDGKVIMVK